MNKDEATFIRALDLASSAIGIVGPRPPVGAIVVNDGNIAGEGTTSPSPGPHAEITALRQAGDCARGGTLYVTLEPCSHTESTPPCTMAILASGIARVVAPVIDPNPRVSGSGFKKLRQGGVVVDRSARPELKAKAERLIQPFAKHVRTGRPLVTAKFAMSIDGKIATRTGHSRWITGLEARKHVHRIRFESEAIMVGIGTVLSDDPMLTARDDNGNHSGRPRLRVIVDSNARLPQDSRLLGETGQVLWAVDELPEPNPARSPHVSVFKTPLGQGGLDLGAVLREVGDRGHTSVLVEGGGNLLGSLFDQRLVDRVAVFVAPKVIGGEQALSPVAGRGIESLADALQIQDIDMKHLGQDILITGRVSEVHGS